MDRKKHLGLRIDNEVHYKLHFVSKYEGRSANGQIMHLINKCISAFEKEHGEIEVPVDPKAIEEAFFS